MKNKGSTRLRKARKMVVYDLVLLKFDVLFIELVAKRKVKLEIVFLMLVAILEHNTLVCGRPLCVLLSVHSPSCKYSKMCTESPIIWEYAFFKVFTDWSVTDYKNHGESTEKIR